MMYNKLQILIKAIIFDFENDIGKFKPKKNCVKTHFEIYDATS